MKRSRFAAIRMRRVDAAGGGPDGVGHGGAPMRQAGMTGLGLLDGVSRQEAQGVDGKVLQLGGLFHVE